MRRPAGCASPGDFDLRPVRSQQPPIASRSPNRCSRSFPQTRQFRIRSSKLRTYRQTASLMRYPLEGSTLERMKPTPDRLLLPDRKPATGLLVKRRPYGPLRQLKPNAIRLSVDLVQRLGERQAINPDLADAGADSRTGNDGALSTFAAAARETGRRTSNTTP